MIILSDTQNKAANGIIECFVNNQKIVKLAGFAGTGKTTIIRDIIQKYKSIKNLKSIAYVTFTGKASTVLKSKISDIMDKQDFCGTIHSLIYKPLFKKDILTGKSIISKWVRADSLPYELIVVDESSMLPNDILNDLKTYNIPMLLVGDHGQLPPVSENQESVLINPDFVLTEIHRQCENNPIIKLSQYVRNMGILPNSAIWSKEVFKLSWNHDKCKELFYNINFNNNDLIVLCAFNKTRVKINNIIREKLGFTFNEPYPGEKVICLKNNRNSGIMNGQTGSLLLSIPINKNTSTMTISMDGIDFIYNGKVNLENFGKESYEMPNNKIYDQDRANKFKYIKNRKKYSEEPPPDMFDFGYCISTHKSQGSEWDNVVLFDQRSSYFSDEYYAKWLYTSLTRARKKLFMISDFY